MGIFDGLWSKSGSGWGSTPKAQPATPVRASSSSIGGFYGGGPAQTGGGTYTGFGGFGGLSPQEVMAQQAYSQYLARANYLGSGGGFTSGQRSGGYGGGGGGGGMSADAQRQLLNLELWQQGVQREQEYSQGKTGIDLINQGLASQGRMIDYAKGEWHLKGKALDVDEGSIQRQIGLVNQMLGFNTKEYNVQTQRNTLAQQGAAWERDFGIRRLMTETGLDLQELQDTTGLGLRELRAATSIGKRELTAQVGAGRERVNEFTDLGLRRINWGETEDYRNLLSNRTASGAVASTGHQADRTNIKTQAEFGREELTDKQKADLKELGIQEQYGMEKLTHREKFGTEELQMREKYGTTRIQNLQKFESEKINKLAQFQIQDLKYQAQLQTIQYQAQQAQTQEQGAKLHDEMKKIEIARQGLYIDMAKLNEEVTQLGIAMGKSALQSQGLDTTRTLRQIEEEKLRVQLGAIV